MDQIHQEKRSAVILLAMKNVKVRARSSCSLSSFPSCSSWCNQALVSFYGRHCASAAMLQTSNPTIHIPIFRTMKDMKSMKVRAQNSSIPVSGSSWCSPKSKLELIGNASLACEGDRLGS